MHPDPEKRLFCEHLSPQSLSRCAFVQSLLRKSSNSELDVGGVAVSHWNVGQCEWAAMGFPPLKRKGGNSLYIPA